MKDPEDQAGNQLTFVCKVENVFVLLFDCILVAFIVQHKECIQQPISIDSRANFLLLFG